MTDEECVEWVQQLENGLFFFQKANVQLTLQRQARKPDSGQIAAWQSNRERAARIVQTAIEHLASTEQRIAALERQNAAMKAFLLVLFPRSYFRHDVHGRGSAAWEALFGSEEK